MTNYCSRTNYSSTEKDIVLTLGHSFRCGVLASYTSQEAYWTYAWQRLAEISRSQEAADKLLCKLTTYVKNILVSSMRNLDILPNGCPGLCRDECLAVSIILASQRGPCPALKACAFALLENSHMEPCLTAAISLGSELQESGIALSTALINDGLEWTFLDKNQKFFHA